MTQDKVTRWFRSFAERECKGYSDRYYRLANTAADDDRIMAFVSERPDPQPNLFLAAIQFLTGPDAMPTDAATLSKFVDEHRSELIAVMESHHTQTNEVGRCAVLLPAMPSGPLALIEVGTSGGLCLLIDRCFFDYGAFRIGDPDSPVTLRCSLSGNSLPELRVPDIWWRHGLDIAPVDLHDDDQVRWLRACIWPDHVERRQRFDAAVQLWRGDPPALSHGDLVDDLPVVVAAAPADARLVVFHSAVFPYVTAEKREQFVETLRAMSFERPITWVSNESRGFFPWIDASAPHSSPTKNTPGLVVSATLENGNLSHRLVGIAQAHGAAFEAVNISASMA
jgi:hypothetical protein